MNIRAALSYLNSGKKVKRKSWNDNSFIIKGIISIIDNGEYMFPKYYKCYDSNFESFYEWLADADDLMADDWICVNENKPFVPVKVDDKYKSYYSTTDIAKELNMPVRKVFAILVRDNILKYDVKKKIYVLINDNYSCYIDYKVNYKTNKKMCLKWNEKGREWLIDYINFSNSIDYYNSVQTNEINHIEK